VLGMNCFSNHPTARNCVVDVYRRDRPEGGGSSMHSFRRSLGVEVPSASMLIERIILEGGSMATLCLRERPGVEGGEQVFIVNVDCNISRKRAAGSFRSRVHAPFFPNTDSIVKSNSFSFSSRTE